VLGHEGMRCVTSANRTHERRSKGSLRRQHHSTEALTEVKPRGSQPCFLVFGNELHVD
jgi:hypothetical protein